MDWTEKVCVITGASSGIGRRTAVEFARRGATVCAVARREDRLEHLVSQLGGEPHSYEVVDVTSMEEVTQLAAIVRARHGACHVLVNNAGIAARGSFADDGPTRIEKVLKTNLLGAANCTSAFLQLLRESTPATVVNVASVAGRIPTPGNSAYVASKFALVGWTESLRPELASWGIRLSSVEPGFVVTEGFPNQDIASHPLLRFLVSSDDTVARAIVATAQSGRAQRVVPRGYYALQLIQIVMPRLFRSVLPRVVSLDSPTSEVVGSTGR